VNIVGDWGGIIVSERATTVQRPKYETPTIRVMSERDILNSFQITQSMASWWTSGACC
jgi:hypothetical protein